MKKTISGVIVSLFLLSASSMTALASGQAEKGADAFRACYETSLEKGVVGAPVLNIKIVVDEPDKRASGMGVVKWASVKSFKTIKAPIDGPWYFMCTSTSCEIRFDFSSAPGAKDLKGMLVVHNWGSPGTFKYEFEGSPGYITQDAAVCN